LWNVFTPEYKNREGRLAFLEHMVREMNIPKQIKASWTGLLSIQ
jgi:hypothetical protein